MTQDEADRELGRIVRETLINVFKDSLAREIDVAMDIPGVSLILARIHTDLAGKYI